MCFNILSYSLYIFNKNSIYRKKLKPQKTICIYQLLGKRERKVGKDEM